MAHVTEKDLTWIQGDDWPYTVTLVDRAGTAIDITGASAWFTIKDNKDDVDGSAILQKSVGSGITLTDPTNGELEIQIDEADLKTQAQGTYYYDLKIKLSSGRIHTALRGCFIVEDNVTETSS